MRILAIDTSGQTAGAAIVDEQSTIGEWSVNAGGKLTHSEILLPMIDQLFTFTRLTLKEIDYIACVSGPGSFTGLRIGAATAEGLAKGAGKPLLAVPTLDALAYNIGCGAAADTVIVPLMDARRSQVYAAFYQTAQPEQADETAEAATGHTLVRRISNYMAVPVKEALVQLAEIIPPNGQAVFLGDGADAYADALREAGFSYTPWPNANRQRAASAGAWAAAEIAAGRTGAPFALTYLRRPQAERMRFGGEGA